MRVCGIICEYNPLHNGHAHHLAQARALSGADFVACVMSGSFTQRGEVALLDKFTRARMALLAGADVVLELPTLFAVRPAEQFALGGVALLRALGCDSLAFGSECSDLATLRAAAALLEEEPPAMREAMRAELSGGAAHVRARMLAVAEALPEGADRAALSQPNSALAICYLRAIARLGGGMEPVLIPRTGSGYHDPAPGAMASATAIRAAVADGRWRDVRAAMPAEAYALLDEARALGRLHAPEALDTALLALLRTQPPEALAALLDVSEGLEHRIRRAARTACTREQLLEQIKCKRYTRARLSRVLCAALLGITGTLAQRYPLPPYARLLGFRREAAPLLAQAKQTDGLPIISKVGSSSWVEDACFQLDLRASDLWALGCAEPSQRAAGGDFFTSPVVL